MSFVKKKKGKKKKNYANLHTCIQTLCGLQSENGGSELLSTFKILQLLPFWLQEYGFKWSVWNGRLAFNVFCRYSVKHALVVNWVPVHGCIEWYSMEATELLLLCLMPYVYYVWFGWSCTQFIDESPGLTRPVNYLSMVYNNKITYSQSFFQLD